MKTYLSTCRSILGLLFPLFFILACGSGRGGNTPITSPVTTTVTPTAGIYGSSQSVTLNTNTASTIYYSLDGDVPSIGGLGTKNSKSPITNIQFSNDTNLLQFFAVDSSGNTESVKSETYVITGGTATGPGDTLQYYPMATGNAWVTTVTATETGYPSTTYTDVSSVTGTKIYKGITAIIAKESNPDNTGVAVENLAYKSSNGFVILGSNNLADAITPQVSPYYMMQFPSDIGSSFVSINKSNLDYGADLDLDGKNETIDLSYVHSIKGLETVTVPIGTFFNCLKQEMNGTMTLTLSSNKQQITLNTVETRWYAPGVGPVKDIVVTTQTNDPTYQKTVTEELIGYIIDGHGSGIRTEITPSVPQIIKTGDTLSFSPNAFDIYNNTIANPPMIWRSSNPAVASIDANGVVTGLLPGVVSITVTAGDVVSNPVQVTVLRAVTFGIPATFTVDGAAGLYAAAGDLNGDGKLDLALTNSNAHTVSILLGDGKGNFSSSASYTAGGVPYSVAIADFNGDGTPDLAVANWQTGSPPGYPGSVSILMGTGAGSFSTAATYTLSGLATSSTPVAIGDFNNDTFLDLAVITGTNSGGIDILWGRGDGTFTSSTTAYVEKSIPSQLSSVTAGDFDGDGNSDLAFTDLFGRSVGILLSNGAGSFGPVTKYTVPGQATYVAVGDFNGDGILDLAVANSYSSNFVSILLGTGNGTFAQPVNYVVGGNPNSIAIADFNGDGYLDLAVANYTSSTVSILLGTGTGTFASAITIPVSGYPYSVTAGDINGDGKPDLIVRSLTTNIISVILNATP